MLKKSYGNFINKKDTRGVTLYNSLDDEYRPWGKINLSWPNANTFGPKYVVSHPKTGKPVRVPDRGWRWKEDTFKEHLGDGKVITLRDGTFAVGQIWFDKEENTQPSLIKYLAEVDRILLRSVISLKSDEGIELEKIFGEKAKFAYPKPTNLIQLLINSIEMEAGDIIFNSFAGSGTTGQAVLSKMPKMELKENLFLLLQRNVRQLGSENTGKSRSCMPRWASIYLFGKAKIGNLAL